MSQIVGGFYLGLVSHPQQHVSPTSIFWTDFLLRVRYLKPSCLLLLSNQQTAAGSDPHPYSLDCAESWQLAGGPSDTTLTLPGHSALAGHLALDGYQHGVDWRLDNQPYYNAPMWELASRALRSLTGPNGSPLPCIPLRLHGAKECSFNLDGCIALGHEIRAAISRYRDFERIVLIACHQPVMWPSRGAVGTDAQQAMLRKAIEQAELETLRTLHTHVIYEPASRALELLACAMSVCASRYSQWLEGQDGARGVQLWPDYLQCERTSPPLSEYAQHLLDNSRRRASP